MPVEKNKVFYVSNRFLYSKKMSSVRMTSVEIFFMNIFFSIIQSSPLKYSHFHHSILLLYRIFLEFFSSSFYYINFFPSFDLLHRPVSNNTDTVLVKLGLRLSQLIDRVRKLCFLDIFYSNI